MYARADKIFALVPIRRLHNIQFITRTAAERVIKEQTKKWAREERRDLILLNDNRYDSRAICPLLLRGKSKSMSKVRAASGVLHPWLSRVEPSDIVRLELREKNFRLARRRKRCRQNRAENWKMVYREFRARDSMHFCSRQVSAPVSIPVF